MMGSKRTIKDIYIQNLEQTTPPSRKFLTISAGESLKMPTMDITPLYSHMAKLDRENPIL